MVIVSDIPANLEVGLDAKCYFPCGDVDALAERIGEVLVSPSKKQKYNMSKYDWDEIASQVMEVYKEL